MSDIILADGYPGGDPGDGGGTAPPITNATISDLGERALRRLNVAVVAIADRPDLTVAISVREITGMALQNLGVIVTDADRPDPGVIVSPTTIAERTLQDLSIIVTDADRPGVGTPLTVTELAEGALRKLDIPVAQEDRPDFLGTVSVPLVAERALREFGIVVPEGVRPGVDDPLGVLQIAEGALRRLGVPIAEEFRSASQGTISVTQIAERALREFGIVVPDEIRPNTDLVEDSTGIANQALLKLGVFAPDENPAANDLSYAKTLCELIHDSLVAQGLVFWTFDTIPVAVVEDYVLLTALHAAAAFGKPADPAQQPVLEARIAKVALTIQAQNIAEQRVATEHDALVARGFALWDVNHVPVSAADDYVELVALGLAPLYGGKDDPQLRAVVSARVGRTALGLQGELIAMSRVHAVHDSLVSKGYAFWDSNVIPMSVTDDYMALTALALAPLYGKELDPAQQPILEARIARIALVIQAQDIAEQRVATEHDALVALGLVLWDVNNIPFSAADDYVHLVALGLAPLYGGKDDPALRAIVSARVGKTSLISQAQQLAESRVNAVHDALVLEGYASWTAGAVPLGASDDYMTLTALTLAPLFGKELDPGQRPILEAHIARISLVLESQNLAERRVLTVHDALSQRGLASWHVDHIPLAAADDYVVLVVAQIAPVFDKPPVDPARVALVESRVGKLAFVIESETLVEGMVAAVHDSLVAQAFIPWSLNKIPQCVADDYASLTQVRAAPLLGLPDDPKSVEIYEGRIKRAVMVLRSPALATQAVMAVHSDLAARGKVRWSIFDIPDFVEYPYVVLAANVLAPNFQQKPDPVAEQEARMAINRLIALPSSGMPVVAGYF